SAAGALSGASDDRTAVLRERTLRGTARPFPGCVLRIRHSRRGARAAWPRASPTAENRGRSPRRKLTFRDPHPPVMLGVDRARIYNQKMGRLLVLLLITGLLASAQLKQRDQKADPATGLTEEDEDLLPQTEYVFNPIQAQRDVKIGDFYAKKGNHRAAVG